MFEYKFDNCQVSVLFHFFVYRLFRDDHLKYSMTFNLSRSILFLREIPYSARMATNAETNTIATVFRSLITVFKAGPAVSL